MANLQHEVIPVAPGCWCISEFKLVNAFLLAGETSAALIDTGCGIGDIRAVAEGLTEKPLTVLLTHGHPDHIGGLYRLKDRPVYLDEADRAGAAAYPTDNNFRRMYIETRAPVRFPGEEALQAMLALLPQPDPGPIDLSAARPLAEGEVFDLGGRSLRVLHTPGHSAGSVCFLDEGDRILFSGDTVNNSIILMRQPGNSLQLVQVYHDTLARLWAESGRYDRLAIGHDGVTIDKQIVHDYLRLTAGLLDGSITGRYEETGFRKGDVARLGLAELWYQCDE